MKAGADEPIARLAERQHGIVSLGQLRELGYGDTGIYARLRRGSLRKVHRGVYAVGHRRLTKRGIWIAAVLACGRGAVLSHGSAGGLLGLIPPGSGRTDVTVPREIRSRPSICAHMSGVAPDEREVVEGIPVTDVSRTLLDLAPVLSRGSLERALNEAEVLGLRSRVPLQEALRRHPHRRGLVHLRHLLAEGAAERGITKRELEARFADLLDANRLPRPLRNAAISVRGRFFEADCLWPDQRVIVELDGRAVHATARAFERDRSRDRILLAEGYRSSRVTWRALRDEPVAVLADLRSLLGG